MSRPDRGRRDHAVRASVLALCFAVLYVGGVVAPWGQWADAVLFSLLTGAGAGVRGVAGVLREGLVVVLGTTAAVVGLLALRGRRRGAVVAWAAVVVASVTLSSVLRDMVLTRPVHDEVFGYAYNTFPSTHVTVTTTLGLAVVALWPSRGGYARVVVREAVLVAVVLACLVNVVTFAHRPADVLGALLLAGCLASVAGTIHPAGVSPLPPGKFTQVTPLPAPRAA